MKPTYTFCPYLTKAIHSLIRAIGFAYVMSAPLVHAVFVVTPNTAANNPGNSSNASPFGNSTNPNASSGVRYQQLYNASFFSAINSVTGLYITDISFRLDSTGSAFASTLPSIRIDLSTTRVADDSLSTNFANNVGTNNTIVYGGENGGPLSLSSSDTVIADGTTAFDITIHLATPFLYRPANGTLLMDVRNFGGGPASFFDAAYALGDGVSRVESLPGGLSSPTAYDGDSLGLITAFTLSGNIPEPATWSMLLSGLTLGAVLRLYLPNGRHVEK